MTTPIKLHRHALSGHCHRVELMLSLLGVAHEALDVDLASGAHKQPEFRALNVFGQVPVIEDNGVVIADSNAILVYLASRYDEGGTWYPTESDRAAHVQRFLSAAAGPIAFGPAAARLVTVFGATLDHEGAKQRAHAVLSSLDAHLESRDYLVDTPTVADVACYSYIAHAPEGGVALDDYPNVRSWLQRIEAWDGFVPMQQTRAGLVA